MAKFVHCQDDKMPACLRLGDFSHGKRKGVTLFLGEFFELHLSVDGTLSQGAERYKLQISYSKYKENAYGLLTEGEFKCEW